MSLINDYLKKTEHNTKGATQIGDLPPVLKTTGKSSWSRVYLRIISIVLLILIAGAGYYLYTVPEKIKKNYGINNQVTADKVKIKKKKQKVEIINKEVAHFFRSNNAKDPRNPPKTANAKAAVAQAGISLYIACSASGNKAFASSVINA